MRPKKIKKANLLKRIHPYKNDIPNNLWPQKPVRYWDYLTNFGRAKTFVYLPVFKIRSFYRYRI